MPRILSIASTGSCCSPELSRRRSGWSALLIWLLLSGVTLPAQIVGTNQAATNQNVKIEIVSRPATNSPLTFHSGEHIQSVREACINNRRRICGRVVQILPDGLVVDSGYLGLLKPELSRSWVIHSNVPAKKSEDYVEENTPGAVCQGLVFISDIPRRPAVKPYDYVVLQGYPVGAKTYTSVGTVHRTVRKFSAVLVKAVDAKLAADAGEGTNAVIVK